MLEVQNRAKSSPDQPSSSTVSITVLSVTPMRPQKLRVRLYRNRHRRRADRRSRNSRDARRLRGGSDRAAQVSRWRWCVANGDYLAEEIYTPIARAVLDKLVERGLIAKWLRGPNVKRDCMGLHVEKRATSNPPGISSKERGGRNCLAIGSAKAGANLPYPANSRIACCLHNQGTSYLRFASKVGDW